MVSFMVEKISSEDQISVFSRPLDRLGHCLLTVERRLELFYSATVGDQILIIVVFPDLGLPDIQNIPDLD